VGENWVAGHRRPAYDTSMHTELRVADHTQTSGVSVDFTVKFEPVLTNLSAVNDVASDATLPAAVFLQALQAPVPPAALSTGLAQYGTLSVAFAAPLQTEKVVSTLLLWSPHLSALMESRYSSDEFNPVN
jgi:hypothetical protein